MNLSVPKASPFTGVRSLWRRTPQAYGDRLVKVPLATFEVLLITAELNYIDLLRNIADKKSIVICDESSDDVMAIFDLTLISIVIRNLLANAIKFTPINGEITIKIEQDKYQTLVSVKDSGVGISDDRIENLFDDTTFEPTFGTDREKGSGLGLKLCKYFIEKHNGKIWVESEVDKGSKFTFSIPANLK